MSNTVEYIEIKFTLPEAYRDIIIAELSNHDFDTFLETDEGFNTYAEDPNVDFSPIEEVIERYKEMCTITYESTTFPDKNWNEEWEKNFEPIVVEEKCLIRAPFHDIDKPYELEILINPKMAFGTGHHATTYLMIAEMLKIDLQDTDVLDLGCGTGILAIAAVKRGANKVWATDINDWSIQNSKENFELNDCHGIKLLCGQIDELDIPLQFDLVLANINRNVLLEEIPSYLSKMKSEATLLLSGFFEEDEHLIRGKAEECGLVVKQRDVRNNWCVLSCQLS